MVRRAGIVTILLGSLVMAACDRGADGKAEPAAGASAEVSPSPRGWNAMDACSTATAAVTQAAGSVTASEPGPQVDSQGGAASFSSCTFELTSGEKVSVLTRESPSAENIPAALAEARKMAPEMDSTIEDVPGIGRAAIWTDKPPAVQVFIDDRRYATISVYGTSGLPKADESARRVATEIARKLAS